MCGFTGFLGEGEYDREATIEKMSAAIAHRGPDSEGKFVADKVALGFRRLSIIDLAGGNQPIYSPDGRYVIVFNGEIYNYRELKKVLSEQFGHIFSTDSDTEVVLHSYMQYGTDCADKLRGMFAFVIYDREKKSLYGARDCFGIKPFYWAEMENTFFFGSEIKSFLPHPRFVREIEAEVLPLYLEFQYSPLEQTIFKGVHKLLPGCWFTYDAENGMQIQRYYELTLAPSRQTFDEAVKQIDETVISSVAYHQIADVEVGSFLSGGVDSSYVAAVARPDKTYSVGFEVKGFDETDYAAELCRRLGINNRKKEITPEEFFEALPAVQYHSDEPHANLSAVPLYYLSRLAAEDVKVVLSGEGADELFGGYDSYTESKCGAAYRKLPLSLRRLAGKLFGGMNNRVGRFVAERSKPVEEAYIGQAFIMTDEEANMLLKEKYRGGISYREVTKPYFDKVHGMSDLHKKMYLDMNLWLPNDILLKADKMTMAHSLELRVPYLDREVWKLARTLGEENQVQYRRSKAAFRSAADIHIPKDWSDRKKLGFMVPFRVWIREERYYNLIKEKFSSSYAGEFFDTEKLLSMLEQHKNGEKNNARKIYTVYSFLLWYEQYFILR